MAELREFAGRYTAAWCSHEANRVASFYSPEGSLTVNSEAPAVGRRAIAELAQSFITAFPDLHLTMDKLEVREECAEYHWTLTGTNNGPGGGGNRVRISGFERWRLGEDGLIVASQGQFDSADYRRQLGLLPGSA
ncbi:MAG TPA: nuclear transport factor 2 family protein [Candidatus Limnocylindrales bacterium]|nr:nuclear transport factor 2 family protein [Candidatus Limnocylindrales bacterium]